MDVVHVMSEKLKTAVAICTDPGDELSNKSKKLPLVLHLLLTSIVLSHVLFYEQNLNSFKDFINHYQFMWIRC